NMIQQEILTLTENEFEVQFPAEKMITADWTSNGVKRALDQQLADPEVDLLLAMGVLASQDVSTRGDLPKPVFAPFVVDAELQGLPSQNGASGVKNLNYLSLPARAITDVRLFHEIVPFDELTIILNKEVWDSIPQLSNRVRAALEAMEVEVTMIPVERSIDSTLGALIPETQAVYVAPILHLLPGHFERLIQHLNDNKIPSFSLLGVSEVKEGIFATASPDIFPRISRRVALNVQRVLLGEDAGTIPTAFAVGQQIIINMQTARTIGVFPPFSVTTEAVLLNEQRDRIERTVSLSSVLQEAVDKNLDLAAEARFVQAGEENIRLARSQLLPQIDFSATGVLIDKDRAEASFGSQAQRSLRGGVTATQLLYSEPAWANLSIQNSLQDVRLYERNQLALDISQDAATTYLNVLRAETFEAIQKDNLKRTRSNLELAQVRENIGASNRSEVFRWESEIATARKDVIDAIAQRNVAEIALNRLLHRPLEDPFETAEADINDSALGINHREGIAEYLDDLLSFKTFRAFMVEWGLEQSSEIQSLDAAISAKEREYRSTRRAFWSPTIALRAEYTSLWSEGGAGVTSPLTSLPDLGSVPLSITEANDHNWSVALNFSIPIFEGSSRFAQRSRAYQELSELQITRQSVAEKIEQRVRSALHIASASRVGIQLSRDAADAADRNLDLVTDSYSRGVVDIIDLLDAQNAALNADLGAANAVHDYLIDLMEVERSIGGFYYFATQEEKDSWFQSLQDFFQKAGVLPRGRDRR
ncbi:TolC family protein, partial [bacterium]|nr:TolC family protein [bacterium]